MMICKICAHGDRAAIDKALIEQRSLRDVAGQFGVSRSALDRHKKHIPKALAEVKRAETVAESTSLLSRVEKLMSRCEAICEKATAAGKWAGAAMAAKEVRGCLELLGKISGELQPKRPGVAINFGDITTVDVRALTDEQLSALYERLTAGLSDEQIDAQLTGMPQSLSEALLFDEESVPGPSNYETCKRCNQNLRELDIANGKTPRGWNPWRSATAADRFRMLLAAWSRITGEDLAARILPAELGPTAIIQIEFDLASDRDQWSESWPKAKLLAPQRTGSKSLGIQ